MRKIATVLILLVVIGCKRQKEQVENFIFDISQINTKQLHKYAFYDDGKIKIDKTVIYSYIAGTAVDSLVSTNEYSYNEKGLIEKIAGVENGDRKLKFYNYQDSLVVDLEVNKNNDTTFLEKTAYNSGLKSSIIRRVLLLKLPDFENPKEDDLRSFDTLFSKRKFVYQGKLLSKTYITDQKGKLEIHHFYKNGIESKRETYSFIRGIRFLKETAHYDLENNRNSDYTAISNEGDTLTSKKSIKQHDLHIISSNYKNAGIQILEYYDLKGQLIGTIDINLKEKVKNIHSFSYDNKGNLLEEASYRQKLNNIR